MKLFRLNSLRIRIFVAMITLVFIASILIALVTIYQYSEETKDYHTNRLERKQQNIIDHINFIIKDREMTYEVKTENIPLIFKDEIYKISEIHKLEIIFYDLEGALLKSSKASIGKNTVKECLNEEVLNPVAHTPEHRIILKRNENDKVVHYSFCYINDLEFKPIAILNIPYLEEDDTLNKELKEFFIRLSFAYLFMIGIAIILAYFLSEYITRALKTISNKINQTRLEKRNEKIEIDSNSEELSTLIKSYNSMIDELEESAVKLAMSEREQAWREMAKQVAHEIKNPLTPMRLSVQNFQRKFDPNDPEIKQKVDEYSATLIQQIDIMSAIASTFSTFAQMPVQQKETLNVVEVIKLALDIFNENDIKFTPQKEHLIAEFDKTQLIRVVTNLVKNAIQSIPKSTTPQIEVLVSESNSKVELSVSDNGIGIAEHNKLKIFEPKFTTKTSGMGLGLAIVKNIIETYNGYITFVSEKNKGSTFTVTFPKE